MIKQISIKTKLGWISAFERNNKIFEVKFGKYKNKSTSKNLERFKTNLRNFLLKKNKLLKFNTFVSGNHNEKKVWNELRKIKFGKTKTYGAIAKKFQLSPRYIGKICSKNKLILFIPCHRVIRSNGNLGGFSATGGIILKKKLLDFEKN